MLAANAAGARRPITRVLRSRIDRRSFELAVTVLVFAGAVIGGAFGGRFAIVTPVVAFLYGGFVHVQNDFRYDREVYGNVLVGIIGGTTLGWISTSVFVSSLLGVPFMSVLWSTAMPIMVNGIVISYVLLVGFAAAVVVTAVRVPRRDASALFLLGTGLATLVLVQLQIAQLLPNCGNFCRPMLSRGTQTKYLLYQILRFIAGGAILVGFLGGIRSRSRLRLVIGVFAVLGILVGTSGVGNVYAQVRYTQAAGEVSDHLSVSSEEVTVAGETLIVSVRIHNPSSQPVTVEGGYLRLSTPDDVRIAYGAGQIVGAEVVRIAPGETRTVTYRVSLTGEQAARAREALSTGGVTLSGKISLDLTNAGGLSVTQFASSDGFVYRFECDLASMSIECR